MDALYAPAGDAGPVETAGSRRAVGARPRAAPVSVTRLTPRDVEMLRFVGRQRFATVAQVARWSGRSEKKVYPRLCGLRGWELVSFQRPLIERGVYLTTRAGLEVAGLNLPPARIELATFTHDRLVAGLVADLEAAGVVVVTEREMRHCDETLDPDRAGPRYAVTLSTGGRHYPDLVVVLASGGSRRSRWNAPRRTWPAGPGS